MYKDNILDHPVTSVDGTLHGNQPGFDMQPDSQPPPPLSSFLSTPSLDGDYNQHATPATHTIVPMLPARPLDPQLHPQSRRPSHVVEEPIVNSKLNLRPTTYFNFTYELPQAPQRYHMTNI